MKPGHRPRPSATGPAPGPATLTPRERQVMALVAAGKLNKTVARELGISQRTVEIHRARVMEKMQARSVPALVQMIMKLEGFAEPQG